jgi:hypothetical protein
MNEEFGSIATRVLHLMKKSLKRIYLLLIIFIILFIISILDSIYQRCRIIDLLEQYEVVEETETYDVVQDGKDNNNNFITGNNNEVSNGSKN